MGAGPAAGRGPLGLCAPQQRQPAHPRRARPHAYHHLRGLPRPPAVPCHLRRWQRRRAPLVLVHWHTGTANCYRMPSALYPLYGHVRTFFWLPMGSIARATALQPAYIGVHVHMRAASTMKFGSQGPGCGATSRGGRQPARPGVGRDRGGPAPADAHSSPHRQVASHPLTQRHHRQQVLALTSCDSTCTHGAVDHGSVPDMPCSSARVAGLRACQPLLPPDHIRSPAVRGRDAQHVIFMAFTATVIARQRGPPAVRGTRWTPGLVCLE